MDDRVVVLATFRPAERKAPELEALLRWMAEHSRAERGCEAYDLYRTADADITYHLIERYRDAEALEAHRATDHYLSYRQRVSQLLAGPIEVVVLRPIDVAGP